MMDFFENVHTHIQLHLIPNKNVNNNQTNLL